MTRQLRDQSRADEPHAPSVRTERSEHKTSIIAAVVLATALAACGGSDSGDDAVDEPAVTTTTATVTDTTMTDDSDTVAAPDPTTTSEASTTDSDTSGDVSTATVTIAGETYEFQSTGFITEQCNPDFFGGAQVILLMADENGEPLTVGGQTAGVAVVLIPDDVDPTPDTVYVSTMDADREWIADPESLVVDGTQVDDWSIDGNRIQGTATFASTAGEGPVQGTFDVTCAEE